MRKRLLAAVALAPLCLAAGVDAAIAQDTVTSGLSSPIATATAGTNGAPADIAITTGSVSISSSAAAVTLNSNNSVSNAGSISVNNASNSAGILADTTKGPFTGSITEAGTISNGDGFSPSTNKSDGLNEAPFASSGSTGRYGIRLIGQGLNAGTTGIDITNTITVNGNSSADVSIEAPLTGGAGLTVAGALAYTGDNGAALQSLRSTAASGSISGPVFLNSTITSTGASSKAVDLEADIGGRLSIDAAITSTGYATTTRPGTTSSLNTIQGDKLQVEQSGGGVVVNGSVGGGIFISAPPIGTLSTSTADADGDGVTDADEGVGSISNYGSAPALAIGNSGVATGTIIGAVGGSDTSPQAESIGSGTAAQNAAAANDFGLIVRGAIAGNGVFDGVPTVGLQIGTSASLPVTVEGGVRVVGSISATSFDADATAIHILAGATVPQIRNEDFIESTISNAISTGTNYAGTINAGATSTGILIDAGGSVSSITNYGTLSASANGDSLNTRAIRDLSGSVGAVLNEGVISAVSTPITTGATPVGAQVAIDLQANTSGVALTQQVNPNPLAIEVSTTTSSTGLVSSTAAYTTVTATTTTTTTTTTAGVTTTTTTTTPTYPEIIGDVLLGSGTNTVSILGGSVTGMLALGDGAGGTLTVGDANNAAIVTGPVTYGGSGLALSVVNGELYNTSPTSMNLSTLNVGAKGVLFAAIDPASGRNTTYNASGAATLASGSQLGIVLNSPLFNETTFTIVKGGSLSDLSSQQLLASNVPYVLVGSETSDAAAGTITVDLRRRTAAEMGLNPAEGAALNAVYASLPNDSGIEGAVLGQYSRSAFLNVYDQLLPDYAGGVFELTLAASDAVTRATSRVNDIENPSGTRGAWAEEVAFGVNHDRDSQSAGFQGGGFGFVGGLETGGAGLGAFGVTGSFLTGDIKDPHAPGDNLASFSEGEFGGYWQAQLGGLRADARAAGGYVLYADRRELLLKDSAGDTTLDRTSKGSSSGYTATGHFGLGYQTGQFGLFYFRPQVRADYFYLNQGGYSEHGGGAQTVNGDVTTPGSDGFDLTLAQRAGHEASGTVSLVTGATFGEGFRWRPELELGYRDVFTGTAGDTTAHFYGGQDFTLTPLPIKGGGPLGRLDIKADTDFYELNFEAGVEQRTKFTEGDLRLSVRVLF